MAAGRTALVLGGAAVAVLSCICLTPRWGAADISGSAGTRQASSSGLPGPVVAALNYAWREVDNLASEVDRKGMVPYFGRRADRVIRKAISKARAQGADAESLEAALDAPLKALYQRQIIEVRARAADLYDMQVAARPNLFEALESAEKLFSAAVSELERPGAGWSTEADREDFLSWLRRSHGGDFQLHDEQGKRSEGKQVTLEVIRKLQQQASTVQREAESRGALPWDIKWQYLIEKSPLGFRGQYTGGRSVVELLLMPDPRYKEGLLNSVVNRIGPMNVAVGFDLFM